MVSINDTSGNQILFYEICHRLVFKRYYSRAVLFFQSLFSTSAFGMSFKYIARWEEQGIGAQWSNLFENPMPSTSFSLGWAMIFLIIDTFVYLILMWYFEHVLPGENQQYFAIFYFLTLAYFSYSVDQHSSCKGLAILAVHLE